MSLSRTHEAHIAIRLEKDRQARILAKARAYQEKPSQKVKKSR